MPAATLPSSLVVMDIDSRKRGAANIDVDESSAPPLKKHLSMSNGAASGEAADAPKFGSINSTWQVDLETIQKDAILRQLKEYKREKQDLEKSVDKLEKASKYHGDHLRIIDAWWQQLIDEVAVIAGEASGAGINSDTSSLLGADSAIFTEHLASRADNIKKIISVIYSTAASSSPEVEALQKRANELLLREKDAIVQNQRLTEERDQMQTRLEDATLRYMIAEKKLDRAKSQAVANIEKQGALASKVAKPEIKEEANGESMTNGLASPTGMASDELQRERDEAIATSTKTKEQLAQLEAQNSKLMAEVTSAKARLDSLTDEDYAGTELFKIMKAQLEESIHKINDLEATHIELREEAKKMHAERSAYRSKINDEAQAVNSSTEQLLGGRDADLQRIRADRNECQSKLQIAEQTHIDRKATVDQATALANARQERINALESEVERLRMRCAETHAELSEDVMDMEVGDLRTKVADLQRECKLLEGELPSIEQAYKKAQAAAAAKLASQEDLDKEKGLLRMGKARADQKYFASMKHQEMLEGEVMILRKSEKTSSGIISSLKEADAKSKELVVNLERQNAEHQDTIEKLQRDRFELESKASQANVATQGHQTHVVKLKEALGEKDSTISALESAGREAQREVEALKVKLDWQTKQADDWKEKANSNSGEEVVRLRRVAFCHCNRGLKNTVLSGCGHTVCRQCVDDRLNTRQRKCPICMKAFGSKDFFTIHLV